MTRGMHAGFIYTHTEKASLESEVCTEYIVHDRNDCYVSKFSPPECRE